MVCPCLTDASHRVNLIAPPPRPLFHRTVQENLLQMYPPPPSSMSVAVPFYLFLTAAQILQSLSFAAHRSGRSQIAYGLGLVCSWASPSFQAPLPSSLNVDEFKPQKIIGHHCKFILSKLQEISNKFKPEHLIQV